MKNMKRFLTLIMLMLMVCMLSVGADAAFSVKKSGVTVPPASMKHGSVFSIRGNLTANQTMKKVAVTIYKGNACVQRYEGHPNSRYFSLANADATMLFNKLPAGTYYYRVSAFNNAGKKKRVINHKFVVRGSGTIKITNPLPSKDITIKKGQGYSIGGKITSSTKIVSITASITNASTKKVYYTKTVKPNTKSYSLSTVKTLDAAMMFNKLPAGKYTFKVLVKDAEGTSAAVILRTVTVAGSSTSTNAIGGNTSNNSDYLNGTGTVPTPTGFIPRTGRPSANNKYFYNSSYNIYYKYNSLGPTGKVYYGSSYVLGNCTWYACGRAMEIVAKAGGNISKVQAIFGGDPVGIYQANVKLNKFKYGKTPKPGALAIFNYGANGDAHIAVVEKVIAGIPYVSESGYTVSKTAPYADKSNVVFKYQSIYSWAGNRALLGYIYLV